MADIKESAERIVKQYLEGQGVEVIKQGWECEAGRADLVCIEDGELAFVTVKARQGLGMPEDGVTAKARSRMETVAASYLASHDVPSCRVRFDVVKLAMIDEGKTMLCHHRDAFSVPNEREATRSDDASKPAKAKKTKAYER
ncbi:MAG: YraN family protein [Coriobacteriales bacterium]|jgi:Holliday junction resolvase-like predicted endonuclease|nr:YraN family protein [Coriobacteriales bacterium]